MTVYTENVIILTKSYKNRKYCVAGINAETGDWIRLVSNDRMSNGALDDEDMICDDESIAQPLDIVRVPVCQNVSTPHQPENVLIAEGEQWEKLGRATLEDVLSLHPNTQNGYVFGNQNYKLSQDEHPGYSLDLIRVTDFTVLTERKLKANFKCNGRQYRYVSLTDPDYYQVENGTTFRCAYLVVSLPEDPHTDGCYYKFIAKVFPVDM